jgi:mannose-6-phosphate isomerase-like protein (cupin superfamily)
MTLQQRPDMLDEDNNQWLQARAGERFCICIPAPLTNNAYSITEFLASPGDSTPIHVHQNEDEHYCVLEGTVRFLIGESSFDASVGEWIA